MKWGGNKQNKAYRQQKPSLLKGDKWFFQMNALLQSGSSWVYVHNTMLLLPKKCWNFFFEKTLKDLGANTDTLWYLCKYLLCNLFNIVYNFWHTDAYGDIPVWFLPLFCGSFPSKNHLNIHLYFLLVLSQFHFHICLFNLSGMYFSIYYKVSIWSLFFFSLSQMIAWFS